MGPGQGLDSKWAKVSYHSFWMSQTSPWLSGGTSARRQLMVPSVGSLPQDAWAVPTVGPQGEICALPLPSSLPRRVRQSQRWTPTPALLPLRTQGEEGSVLVYFLT